MKLAEALQLRGDLQKRIGQLEERLCRNATVQEGELPAEDPEGLLEEFEDCTGQLQEMMSRINRTNGETKTKEGTLTELLARRDCLKIRIKVYQKFLRDASCLSQRAMHTEIRIKSTVSVPVYQKKLDTLSMELRNLDNLIQSENWTTELL